MSTTGMAHRIARDIAAAPDLEGRACADRPDDFDLDTIGKDKAALRDAVHSCRFECPVARACHAWTLSLAGNDATRPNGVVQGGLVWGGMGRSGKNRPRHRAAA